MALTQQHRNVIYNAWAPDLGEEVAEALISHFPARDMDEPVTKEFVEIKFNELRTEIAEHRGDTNEEFANLRGEIAQLRGEMRTEFAGVRGETSTEFASVRGEIAQFRGEMGTELARLRGDMDGGFEGLRAEVHQEIGALRKDLQHVLMWMVGAVFTSAGFSLAISQALN